MSEHTSLAEAALLFHGELRSLHEFNAELGVRADALDVERRERFLSSLKAELGDTLAASSETEASHPTGAVTNDQDSLKKLSSIGHRLQAIAATPDHPSHTAVRTFYAALGKFPVLFQSHGDYFRRGLLSTLTTTLEVLIARLLRDFYARYPDALNDDHKLALADLRSCSSVEAAERLLVEKAIDTLMFRPFDEILDQIVTRLALPKPLLAGQRTAVLELFLRRNLFVHNLGIVNRHYLSKLPTHVPGNPPKEGATLSLDASYLASGIDTVLITGTLLVHAAWTKWAPTEADGSTALLGHLIYESLTDRRFHVVIALAEYSYFLKGISEARQLVTVINHAIALAAIGDRTAAHAVLLKKDWTATSLKFQVAVQILRGTPEAAFADLRKAVQVFEITEWDLRNWPLFDDLRNHPEFPALLDLSRSLISHGHPGQVQ